MMRGLTGSRGQSAGELTSYGKKGQQKKTIRRGDRQVAVKPEG